jgi:hypothetical protein
MWQKHTISKVTPTMYVCDGRRFFKDLRIVGANSFGPSHGYFPTPEIEMQMRIQRASMDLGRITLSTKNIDAAEAFIAASKSTP